MEIELDKFENYVWVGLPAGARAEVLAYVREGDPLAMVQIDWRWLIETPRGDAAYSGRCLISSEWVVNCPAAAGAMIARELTGRLIEARKAVDEN